jgi:uncharacterized repeat protein (TIGR03803 family)
MRSSTCLSLGTLAPRPGSGQGRATRPRTKGWKKVGLLCAIWVAGSLAGFADTLQHFDTLVIFYGTDGAGPGLEVLAQARDGSLWGTTSNGEDLVFSITPAGVLTDVYKFDNVYGGGFPSEGGVVLGTDGYFYGTEPFGGTRGATGVVFKLSPTGNYTALFTFARQASPYGLTLGADGNFYGTTAQGGTSSTECEPEPFGCGTVFKMTPSGKVTTLHNFDFTDGEHPVAPLVQGSDGNFYGTAFYGGIGGSGTVFKMTSTGAFSTLHSFSGPDGIDPTGQLVEGTDGNFYGTTEFGGDYPICESGCGTVFQITPDGVLRTLHSFSYGDGAHPQGGPVQHTSGVFYGTTDVGGIYHGFGTAFSMDMGLGPFIKTVLNFGRVGSTVQILGTDLTGATAVTFNGKPATCFAVVSDTFMTAMVPDGATTGRIEVTTPKGTLKSNVNFNVQ